MSAQKYFLLGIVCATLALGILVKYPAALEMVATVTAGLAVLGLAFFGIVFMIMAIEELKFASSINPESKLKETKSNKKNQKI